jgi:hypothetical protein
MQTQTQQAPSPEQEQTAQQPCWSKPRIWLIEPTTNTNGRKLNYGAESDFFL